MINLAVVELKDVIKYLVRITIVVAVVMTLTRYFSGFKSELENSEIEMKKTTLLSCLDVVIPNIKNANKVKEKIEKKATVGPLKLALEVELGMIDSLSKINNNTVETSHNTVDEEEIKEAQTGLKTEVQESNVPQKFTTTYNGVKIKNETKIKLTDEILNTKLNINKENILIFHTHTCECYTPSEKYQYKKSGNFRTLDKECSVVRVGTELKKYMENYGHKVIHDTTYYDYPSYNSSYDRSLKNVGNLLEKNEGTDILFDIHRDAIGDSSYAPTVKIGDEYAAQLLFVIGSNGGGGKHDDWEQNLKFAITIQEKANKLYPGLFKPIILRNSRYNQQLAKGASIIEVGATGNTLDQCLVSMKYLSKVLSEVLD